tara:strand:- start:191 stop:613 length:423 start_codon:yes stop_codon:yes gene_type:complete
MLNKIEREEALVKAICVNFDISRDMLFSKSRKMNIINGRRMFFYFMRKHFGGTYWGMGKKYNVHHATIMHHVSTMKSYLEFNKIQMINYIKIRDYVFEQNSEVTLSEELALLEQEHALVEQRMQDIKHELKSLKTLKNGN